MQTRFYQGKTILLTGHTGFKGAWLAEWLLALGADVVGLSRDIPTTPSLFEALGLTDRLRADIRADICDAEALAAHVREVQPDGVFHLAAQPLVRYSYREPLETYATNIMGTAHLLEALRGLEKPCTAVLVTTDKCYANREWKQAYRESDPMGGHDPYSSSKGAAELVIHGYRQSYFSATDSLVRIASARAGNVIGGGDFSTDRIVPDCMRALAEGRPIPVRNPEATRPWQHVLEPLSGYLALAEALNASRHEPDHPVAPAYNFGPAPESNQTVRRLVEGILQHWEGSWEDHSDPDAPHEASLLNLASDLAWHDLSWRPRWDFATTLRHTVDWYRTYYQKDTETLPELTRRQIDAYSGVFQG